MSPKWLISGQPGALLATLSSLEKTLFGLLFKRREES
jgi:hypothetical protein